MDEDIPDLRGRDEARAAGEEVGGRERRGLDAEGAEGEEGFFWNGGIEEGVSLEGVGMCEENNHWEDRKGWGEEGLEVPV